MTHCCLPGCLNYQARNPDVSYMKFLKDDAKNREWRAAFLQVVKRYRADKFNVDKAAICSSHFERQHLLFSGRGYKISPGRLPTLNLPTKSVSVSEPTEPRKKPAVRPPPVIPERVKYYDLEEVRRHVTKVEDWFILTGSLAPIIMVKLDGRHTQVLKKICIEADLSYKVTSLGVDVTKEVPKTLVTDGLVALCRAVEALPVCRKCGVVVKETGETCKKCKQSAMKACFPLKINTPLSSANRDQLEAEIRRLRCTVKRKLQTEAVNVQADVQEGSYIIIVNSTHESCEVQMCRGMFYDSSKIVEPGQEVRFGTPSPIHFYVKKVDGHFWYRKYDCDNGNYEIVVDNGNAGISLQ